MSNELEPAESIDTPTTVTIPEPESHDDGGEQDASPANDNATAEQRATRKERRADRYREARESAQNAERMLAQERTERQRLSEQIAELRGAQQAMQRQTTQAQPDPYEKQIVDYDAKAQRHLAAAANAKDQATSQAEMAEFYKAMRGSAAVEARRERDADMQRFVASQPDAEQAGMKVALSADYPWLQNNARARDLADSYIGQLMSRDGKAYNLSTIREACALAARDLGLGGAGERPSDARRAAYSGMTARTGAGGDDGRTHLQMSSDDNGKMKKMAQQLYPSDEPEVAYKKWLKNVGAGLASK